MATQGAGKGAAALSPPQHTVARSARASALDNLPVGGPTDNNRRSIHPAVHDVTSRQSSPEPVSVTEPSPDPDMESSDNPARLHAVSACPLPTPSQRFARPNDAAGMIRSLGLSPDDLMNPEFVAAPLNLPVPFYSRGGADGGRHGCGRGQRVPGASSNSTRTTVCVTSISVDRQSLQKMARERVSLVAPINTPTYTVYVAAGFCFNIHHGAPHRWLSSTSPTQGMKGMDFDHFA